MSKEIFTNKRLGQHWLRDQAVLTRICDLAAVNPDDTILEIGPGRGALTEKLLDRAGKVIAVELDAKLSAALAERYVGSPKLHALNEDIRNFNLTALPVGYKVVANLPYYLTSFLIRQLSESPNQPALCVLLVQKEVAQRLGALPGEMSILSVTAQAFWEISLDDVVPAVFFEPPPKVDSQIVRLNRRPRPQISKELQPVFFQVVKLGFAQKRKTLLNSLSSGLRIDKPTARSYLVAAQIDPRSRPQQLTLANWRHLAKKISR